MTNSDTNQQRQELARANLRLALVLGGIVLLMLAVMFYFWPGSQVPA